MWSVSPASWVTYVNSSTSYTGKRQRFKYFRTYFLLITFMASVLNTEAQTCHSSQETHRFAVTGDGALSIQKVIDPSTHPGLIRLRINQRNAVDRHRGRYIVLAQFFTFQSSTEKIKAWLVTERSDWIKTCSNYADFSMLCFISS